MSKACKDCADMVMEVSRLTHELVEKTELENKLLYMHEIVNDLIKYLLEKERITEEELDTLGITVTKPTAIKNINDLMGHLFDEDEDSISLS